MQLNVVNYSALSNGTIHLRSSFFFSYSVVIAVEKRLNSPLLVPTSVEKIMEIVSTAPTYPERSERHAATRKSNQQPS